MRLIAVIALAMSVAVPASAQNAASLADIRAELTVLYRDILSLKQELDPTGLREGTEASTSTLDRVVSIERSLQVLTARTEELEFRIDRMVADGTNRIGDLEFRLCELEESCDIGELGETPTLGGGDIAVPVTPIFTGLAAVEGEQLAVAEKNDFEAAQIALEEQRYEEAADLFAQFVETYPRGPLGVQAEMGRGHALEMLGKHREAARAYLAAFSLNNEGPEAPYALLQLGKMLAAFSQIDEACIMLGEVGRRFPSSEAALDASNTIVSLNCP